jgi:hypothetical protein
MFLGQVEDEIGLTNIENDPVQQSIIEAKHASKYNKYYKRMGEIIPEGVLVEENKRRKIL